MLHFLRERRLSLWETIGDAYLLALESCERTIICDLPKASRDLPLPRIVGWTSSEMAIALIPGHFLERLLNKKGGFSETENYLKTQSMMLGEDASGVVQIVWDPSSLVPEDRVVHLRQRLSNPLKHVTESQLKEDMKQLRTFAQSDEGCLENWFMESWRWIARMEQSDSD